MDESVELIDTWYASGVATSCLIWGASIYIRYDKSGDGWGCSQEINKDTTGVGKAKHPAEVGQLLW